MKFPTYGGVAMGAEEKTGVQLNGTAPVGAAGSAALDVDPEMLKKLKQRVDDLLDRLGGSNADHRALSHHRIAPASFGQGFIEAQGLADTYEKVLAQLETFSKVFGDQIESLSLGTEFIGRDYEAVDADVRNRMAALQRRTQGFYKAPQPAQQPADSMGPERGDGKSAGSGGI
ncbi:hypothetical protein [Streptomyces sp. NPDC048612]|uniref:hypothetical protein n=1 Tax=Streptomyces sp. NPDC048612 TaxID=3365579 RepID=UPI003716A7E7